MPITLGILAQSRQAVAASDFVLLETQVLGSAQASIEFTNLTTNYASTYKHLQLRMTTQSSSGSDLYMQFNNVTTAGAYSTHYLYGFFGSVSSSTVSNDKLYIGTSGLSSGEAPFTATVTDILDAFQTTKNKTIRSFNGRSGGSNPIVMLTSGARLSTDSITSIKIFQNAGNITQFSRISLYGIKG